MSITKLLGKLDDFQDSFSRAQFQEFVFALNIRLIANFYPQHLPTLTPLSECAFLEAKALVGRLSASELSAYLSEEAPYPFTVLRANIFEVLKDLSENDELSECTFYAIETLLAEKISCEEIYVELVEVAGNLR